MTDSTLSVETRPTSRPRLMIVIVSTRPGRVGLPVARWFEEETRKHGQFEIDVVDLATLDLPMFDEPRHPRLQQYEHAHTREWSKRVNAADAVVFVMPEYNYGFTAPFKNAVDYLNGEWAYKPVGFVSYGGVSAGTRAVQMAKQVLTTLKMMPVPEAVAIPFVAQFLKDGAIHPNEIMVQSAAAMLDELARWTGALRPLRSTELTAATAR